MSTVRTIERTWLDLAGAPLDERFADAAFQPDEAGLDYCPLCLVTVGPAEVQDGRCPDCRGRRLPWLRGIRLGEYVPPLDRLIHEVKYTRWRRLGLELGERLGESVAASLADAGLSGRPVVVVPVPASFRRRFVRGIDHTQVIGRGVADALRGRLTECLAREHRASQLSLPVSRRRTNPAGSFWTQRSLNAGGAIVVLVDDVLTTGATMRAAAAAIRSHTREIMAEQRPLEVWAAVVSVTPDPRRRMLPGVGS